MPSRPGSRRPTRRRLAAGAVVVVVLAAAGVTVWATTSGSGPSYRAAVVTRGAVQQTLTTTGALSPVRSAGADFQVAGTVAKVRAAVGRKVAAGQTLANLNRSSLRAALTAARSSLTSAKTRLSDAKDGEVSETSATRSATATTGQFEMARPTVTSTATASATPHPSGSARPSSSPHPGGTSPGHGGTSGSSGSTAGQLAHDQAAVVAAQHATDAELAAAKTALVTETKVCAAQLSGGSTSTTSVDAAPLTCAQATAGLLHDQDLVNTDENAVDHAEQTLSTDLAAALKSLQKSQKSGSATSGSHHSTTPTTGSTGSTASFTTASAADLATDEAAIDQASASVATAKADLRQATLTAPIAGTVTAVTISKGDSVSAGTSSASPAIEIVGSRQDEATVYLSDTQIRTVKVGMPAEVTPDGAGRGLNGRVAGIGTSGTESESGSISYPVTVNVTAPAGSLVAGADAAVSIILATATNVIAVPTSAVHYQGIATYVDVLNGRKLSRRNVKVSAIGSALTEITSGLSAGQRVVLANLNAAVPSTSNTLTRIGGGFGGGGGLGGGVITVRRFGGGGSGGPAQAPDPGNG
ncbi:MAG TPA: efflux RND transporter periplasmic adaptor subunit [Mycobacteriales bacterium]|jgi:HlyD family secretion protein|nr:efflux RND transporter periplasmic adaptor subunit [Mycobacteriales bacterium]